MLQESIAEISSDDESTKEQSLSYKYIYGDIEFHTKNLECLEPGSYLKDSIIQLYLAYLINGCDKELADRIHIFDSIFIKELQPVFEDNHKVGPAHKLRQLNKWYSNIDIFQKDYIIFPICSDNHWFVIVACYPRNVKDFKSYYDCKTSGENGIDISDVNNSPGLFVMDSLGGKEKKFTAIIRDFLDYEWRSRLGEKIKRFSDYDIVGYNPKLPKQTNSYDCGIYMLAYVKAFLKDPDTFYKLVRNNDFEAKATLESKITRCLETVTRDSISNLINQICEKN